MMEMTDSELLQSINQNLQSVREIGFWLLGSLLSLVFAVTWKG